MDNASYIQDEERTETKINSVASDEKRPFAFQVTESKSRISDKR